MEIQYIKEFLLFSEILSFSEAAKKLYISQPTLSTHISHLESDLGFKLVVRSNRKSTLTKAGKRFTKEAKEIIDSLDTLVNTCSEIACNEQQEIKIFNFAHYLKKWPLISEIIADNSENLFFEVLPYPPLDRSASPLKNLSLGFIDVAVYFSSDGSIEKTGLFSEYLGKEDLVMYTTSDNPITKKEFFSLEDLKGNTLLIKDGNRSDSFFQTSIHCLKKAGIFLDCLEVEYDDYADVGYQDYSQSVAVCSKAFYDFVLMGKYPNISKLMVLEGECALDVYLVSEILSDSIRKFFHLLSNKRTAEQLVCPENQRSSIPISNYN